MTKTNALTSSFHHATVDLAYKVGDSAKFAEASAQTNQAVLQGTGWQILAHSGEQPATAGYQYKAVAFINHETKQIHIASAGTKPTHLFDLVDDVRLAFFKALPTKLGCMKEFIQEAKNALLQSQDTEGFDEVTSLDGYTWSFSGHSLGAVEAEVNAALVKASGGKITEVVTFDNPGSLPLIKANHLLDENQLNELAEVCTTYLAPKNVVNRTNEQLADKIELVVPTKPVVEEQPTKSSGWGFGFIGSAVNKITEVASSVIKAVVKNPLDYAGFSKFTNDVVYASEYIENWFNDVLRVGGHGLGNFKSLDTTNSLAPIKVQIADWNRNQPVIDESELPKLKHVSSTGKDIVLLGTKEQGEHVFVTQHEFSYSDLANHKQPNHNAITSAIEDAMQEQHNYVPLVVGNEDYGWALC